MSMIIDDPYAAREEKTKRFHKKLSKLRKKDEKLQDKRRKLAIKAEALISEHVSDSFKFLESSGAFSRFAMAVQGFKSTFENALAKAFNEVDSSKAKKDVPEA